MSPSDLPVIRRGQDPNDPVAGLNADWILSPKRRSEEVAQWEALLQQRQNGAVATHLELDLREGGPGSGNWGHAGIPGSRGGSMPGGGHRQLGVGRGASDEEKKEAMAKGDKGLLYAMQVISYSEE